MRVRSLLARSALLAAVLLPAGCGAKFDLPTETTGRPIPSDGSYQMIATWKAWDGIRDLLLTQGGGSQLFALTNTGGSGTGSRGQVVEIARTTGGRIPSTVFPVLFNPVA